jgi:hypothetical protein
LRELKADIKRQAIQKQGGGDKGNNNQELIGDLTLRFSAMHK